MTRRELLSLVSALVFSGAATRQRRFDAAVAKLSSCPLRDVRLLNGPFLDAQKRDLDYLLSLQPDRMLHNFRLNAGLAPKAPVYGGWESEEPWVDIRCHGHTLGHYLTAVSLMYASTDDPRMKQRADYIVDRAAVVSGAVWAAGSSARSRTELRSSRTRWRAGSSSACRGTRCTRSWRVCATRTSTPAALRRSRS